MNGSDAYPRAPERVTHTIKKVLVITRAALGLLGKRRARGVVAGCGEFSSSKGRPTWPHLPR